MTLGDDDSMAAYTAAVAASEEEELLDRATALLPIFHLLRGLAQASFSLLVAARSTARRHPPSSNTPSMQVATHWRSSGVMGIRMWLFFAADLWNTLSHSSHRRKQLSFRHLRVDMYGWMNALQLLDKMNQGWPYPSCKHCSVEASVSQLWQRPKAAMLSSSSQSTNSLSWDTKCTRMTLKSVIMD